MLQDPNAAKTQTPFEELFEFVATSDDSAYLCVPAALKFRKEVCGGEDAIMAYCQKIANDGAAAVAAALGTEVLQEPDLKPGQTSKMCQCALVTVRLPIAVAETSETDVSATLATVSVEEAHLASNWIQSTLMQKYDTFVPVFRHGRWLYTRVSGQIYLELSDFEWLGPILRDLCKQVARKDFIDAS